MLRALTSLFRPRPELSRRPVGGRAAAAGLLDNYSFEVTGAERAVAEACAAPVAPGAEVFIAFVPGESHDRLVGVAARLAAAGLVPVPHVVARSLESAAALDRLLGRLADAAGVRTALVLAGDRTEPAGPFADSRDLIETGQFERHGVARIYLGCYPEPHPRVPEAAMRAALGAKLAAARAHGLMPRLVSQFALDPAPILRRLGELGDEAPGVPIRIGIAGPTSRRLLLKYALYCGVGQSLKALSRHGETMGDLARQESPDALLMALADGIAKAGGLLPPIAGIHLFTFGGVAKSVDWARGFGAADQSSGR